MNRLFRRIHRVVGFDINLQLQAVANHLFAALSERPLHVASMREAHDVTSDGHKAYLEAVEGAFGGDVDYAILNKIYGTVPEASKGRYSPAVCLGAKKDRIEGSPDPAHISTSYVERSNLTMRMHMRRFTRLTNAFSKKVENHVYAVALHMMYYNFVRLHSKLRVTPAMAAGVADRLWEIEDIVKLVEEVEDAPKKRGPYRKRAFI